ncbi:hypothetical protein FE257_003364 [Aspergillus nanangensis]|uniref:Uncharacterized protein n=1 Tax=Aspergillus nanangensis TaxID=2582783 RepID=A0AAD4CBR6_ASPNN|nr:hypothetical protein FE257_003364 [Aspergillus nanangensis]
MNPNHDKRSTRIDLDGVLLSKPSTNESPASVPPLPRSDVKREEVASSRGRLSKRGPSSSLAEPGRKVIRGPPRALALPKINEAGNTTAESELVVRDEAPWETFQKSYECDVAGTVAVCTRQSGRGGPWAIRQYSKKDANGLLRALHCIHHAKFIDGLSYLVSKNFHNPSLDASGVVMNLEGDIQIGLLARLECFSERPTGRIKASDMFPVARVLMQLMQKYVKDDGAVGVDNVKRWPTDSAAVELLCATTSAGSFKELQKVCETTHQLGKLLTAPQQRLLCDIRWSPGDLVGLAWLALISTQYVFVAKHEE